MNAPTSRRDFLRVGTLAGASALGGALGHGVGLPSLLAAEQAGLSELARWLEGRTGPRARAPPATTYGREPGHQQSSSHNLRPTTVTS